MKLSVIMLLCSALSALASNSYSQTKKLNLELKGVSMGQALESIENQSEFYFLYSRKLVDADRLVSINVKNQSIETTLKQLFNGTDVSYVIKDRVIVLTIPGMADNNLAEFFQQQKVTGTVTDVTTGEPIIGANVVIEGTTLGTVTDSEGKFSISITKPDVVILVSFLGYNTERVIFTGQSILEINMVPDITKLDEVVVVGYGTLKKSDLSSAISKVEGNVIHNQPYSSPAAALVGKSPGVHVISNSGAPGSGVTVRIRGASSLSSGGNDPLYIVDGIPTNNILGINPNDIASIEVLKDASSSAIYGSRASNGVILISTKRGVKGKTELDFDMFYGLQRVYKKMPMMNAKEQWEYVQKGITNYNRLNPNNPVQVREQSRLDYEAGYDTDWQNEIFRIAPVQNYSFSASGGAEKVIYSSNIGYFNQQGVVMSNGYQRISGRFTVDYDLTKYLIIGTSISGNYSINDQIPEGDHPRSVVGNLQRKLPYEPVYELDGSYAMREMANVVAVAKEYEGTDYQTAGIGSVYAKFKITKNLEFKTLFSGDFYNTSGDSFFPSNIPGGTNRPSSAFSNRGLTWLNENVLSYSFKVDKVDVKTIAGYSLQESHAFNFNAAASGGPTDIISTMNASVLLEKINSYKTSWGINSLFTRVYINYANRYLASFSIRQDGSSRFGINNQYAIFPAGSIAWRLSEEEFFKNIKAINDLKIRFSIGRTGNQNIGNYVAQGTYLTGANYNGQSGVLVGGIPSGNLSWETTDQYDTGIDIRFFENRLNFSADFYLKKTGGLLFSMPLPNYTGFGSYWTNLGKIENRGMEYSLDASIIQTGELELSAGMNISFNSNKVLQLPDGKSIITNQTTATYYTTNATFLTQEGHPIGEFYGLKWTGEVYATDEIAKAHVSSIMGQAPVGGTLKYEDFSGPNGVPDGKIDSNDRQIIGSPHPKFFGGFNTELNWRNFDIGLQFSFVYGNKIFNQMRFLGSRGFAYVAARKERVDAWSEPGQITTQHKVMTNTDNRDNQVSTKYIEDGSYLRLNNLTLGYSLPKNISKLINIKELRMYFTAQNLLTITGYQGYDPEVNAKHGDIRTQGIDFGMVPQVSTYMIGANIKF